MNVGKVVSALIKYASDYDGDKLLLLKDIYSIEVDRNDEIEISFVDGNTPDVIVDKNGKHIRYVD